MFLDFRHVALGVAAGVGVGLTAGALLAQQQQHQLKPARDRHRQRLQQQQQQQQQRARGQSTLQAGDPAAATTPHPAAKYGLPQTQTMREHEGFVAMFDSATRNPAWVVELVTRDTINGEGERGNSMFYEDDALDERMRNRLVDFRGSGYDRGHLASAANHKGHQGAMDDTFCMSNISPQVGEGFNRDYWARFEKFVKDVAKRSDGLYVATGPLYLPSPDDDEEDGDDEGSSTSTSSGGPRCRTKKTKATSWRARHAYIGSPPALVAVPTHFYKVVLADNDSGKHGGHKAAVGAFVMPNAAIDPSTPLEAFVVPLDALERVAGTTFFPGFVDASRRAALDRTAVVLQERGRAGLPHLDRQALAAERAVICVAPSSSSSSLPALPLTMGKDSVHLCEHVACKLPQEKWWLEGKQEQQQKKQMIRGGASAGEGASKKV